MLRRHTVYVALAWLCGPSFTAAQPPATVAQFWAALPATPSQGKALVYFLRTNQNRNARAIVIRYAREDGPAYRDSTEIGSTTGGDYLLVELDPGRHRLCAVGVRANCIGVQLQADTISFVELTTRMADPDARELLPRLQPMTWLRALEEIPRLRPLNPPQEMH